MPESDDERSEHARAAVLVSWARTNDRSARTANATRARMSKEFADQLDPDRQLDPADLARRVDLLHQAHQAKLRMKALQGRRKSAEFAAQADAADAELAQQTT